MFSAHQQCPLAGQFQRLSLRSPATVISPFQQKRGLLPTPSPSARQIVENEVAVAEMKLDEKRRAFKSAGKSCSLGNAEHIFAGAIFPPDGRHSSIRSDSLSRHPTPQPRNECQPARRPQHPQPQSSNQPAQMRKSFDAIYVVKQETRTKRTANSSNGNGTGNAAGMDEELGEGISAQAQHIIQFCLENARGNLSARVLNRMLHKRPDFALFCANMGADNWSKFSDDFRQYLADVLIGSLQSTEKIRNSSMTFGAEQVLWRSFGFKADFFAEMAGALTTECVFLDCAAHPSSEAIEAWAELVELMFSAVRDGYYSHVRQLRRANFSLGNSNAIGISRSGTSVGSGRMQAKNKKGSSSLEI